TRDNPPPNPSHSCTARETPPDLPPARPPRCRNRLERRLFQSRIFRQAQVVIRTKVYARNLSEAAQLIPRSELPQGAFQICQEVLSHIRPHAAPRASCRA